jgi:hypothetical protein
MYRQTYERLGNDAMPLADRDVPLSSAQTRRAEEGELYAVADDGLPQLAARSARRPLGAPLADVALPTVADEDRYRQAVAQQTRTPFIAVPSAVVVALPSNR